MASCTFCAIATGELPSSLVWRDELVLAFLDIQPRNPGHTLVVPRTHHPSLAALPETTGARKFLIAQVRDSPTIDLPSHRAPGR